VLTKTYAAGPMPLVPGFLGSRRGIGRGWACAFVEQICFWQTTKRHAAHVGNVWPLRLSEVSSG
jgi:hypothetical protein